MNHDSLCPLIPNSCDCDLITRVRADERARCVAAVVALHTPEVPVEREGYVGVPTLHLENRMYNYGISCAVDALTAREEAR